MLINEITDEFWLPPNTIRRRIQTATNRLREHLLDACHGDQMKITKTRILLVENDGDTVELIRLYLDPAGYHMTAASAYDESLKLARTRRSNLYLLGDACEYGAVFDLCRKIRVFDSDTPIIFCTAFAFPADRERGMSAGAQAYLTKPYDLDELVQTIKQLIAKAPAKGRRQKRGPRERANEGARNGVVAQ